MADDIEFKALLDTGDFDAGMAVLTGGLMHIGSLAVDAFLAAGAAVADFASESFQGALDAEQAMTRVESVIRSTGGAAGMTAEEVQTLADDFTTLAGGSDDTVIAIQEMALRMGNISEDQMPNFIQTTLDLAAATGVDAVAGARLMAQAYDDPASAMTKLTKQGILFDTELEAQVKAMSESGDKAGAYALVMERVGEATSGAAAAGLDTARGRMELFNNTISEAGEQVMGAFIGPLSTLFDTVIAPNIPLITQMANDLGLFVTAVLSSGDPLAFLQEKLLQIFPGLSGLIASVQGLAASFMASMPEIMGAAQMMGDFLIGLFGTLGPTLLANVSSFLDSMAAFWNAHGTTIIATVTLAFNLIATVVAVTLNQISGGVAAFGSLLNGDVAGFLGTVQSTFASSMNAILSLVGQDLDTFIGNWSGVFDLALSIAAAIWGQIQSAIGNATAGIMGAIDSVIGVIQDFIQTILDIPALPAWITPGSPTPFETGLWGINDALKAVNNSMPSALNSLQGSSTVNNMTNAPQYNLSVNTQNSTQSVIGNFAVMQAMAGA